MVIINRDRRRVQPPGRGFRARPRRFPAGM